MKPTLKLMVFLLMLFIQNTIYAQTILQKQVLVYFKTGVQRNDTPNQNTVIITSSNITRVLGKYGLSAKNVKPSFPNFNEADTLNAKIGEEARQMNRAKVFTISLPDTSFKSALINSLKNLSEVLYAESDGEATIDVIPGVGKSSP